MKNASCRGNWFDNGTPWQITRRITNKQGHMYKFVVERDAVTHEFFLAQVFTVVCTDDEECAIELTTGTQFVQKSSYLLILVSHFRIIHTIQSCLFFCVDSTCKGCQPAEDIAIEAAQVMLGGFILQDVWRKTLDEAPGWMIGHMGTHQVDEAENWLIFRNAVAPDQQFRSIVGSLGCIAFKT